jgi:predicted transcriptional regulator
MPRLVAEVTEDVKSQLEWLAKAGDRSLAAEVRKAIAAYLAKAGKR